MHKLRIANPTEEDIVRSDVTIRQLLRDLLRLREEVARNMLDPGALILGQKRHHLFRGWSSTVVLSFLSLARLARERQPYLAA